LATILWLSAAALEDADTGAGERNAVPVVLVKKASGAPDLGTATDPVRTDPTGTTTQPTSDATAHAKLDTLAGYLDGVEGKQDAQTTELQAIKAAVDQLEVYLDGVETLLTAVQDRIGALSSPAAGSSNKHLTDLVAKDFATAAKQDSQITELQAIKAAVDQLEGYLDQVEGKLDTIAGHVDGLEAAAGTQADAEAASGNGSQIAILKNLRTRLQSVEDRIGATSSPAAGTVNKQLADLITETKPVTSFSTNQKTVPTGTAEQVIVASTPAKRFVSVVANADNDGEVFVGASGVTTTTGIPLQPGQPVGIPVDDANKVYVIAAASGRKVSFLVA
jgi:hypothetical protein